MDDVIVFVHPGRSWHLYYAVKQAHDRHPHTRIVVISDYRQDELLPYAKILPINEFWSDALKFEAIYQHFGNQCRDSELFGFQRWFVLAAFTERYKPRRLIHLDADLLVYDDLTADLDRCGDVDLATANFEGTFSLLIPKPAVLTAFCAKVTALFSSGGHELATQEFWSQVDGPGSDVQLLKAFVAEEHLRHVDLRAVVDGSAYDSASDSYETEDGHKKLRWVGSQPYVRRSADGALVRLKTLHCAGKAECKIVERFTSRDLAFVRDKITGGLATKQRKTTTKPRSRFPETAA